MFPIAQNLASAMANGGGSAIMLDYFARTNLETTHTRMEFKPQNVVINSMSVPDPTESQMSQPETGPPGKWRQSKVGVVWLLKRTLGIADAFDNDKPNKLEFDLASAIALSVDTPGAKVTSDTLINLEVIEQRFLAPERSCMSYPTIFFQDGRVGDGTLKSGATRVAQNTMPNTPRALSITSSVSTLARIREQRSARLTVPKSRRTVFGGRTRFTTTLRHKHSIGIKWNPLSSLLALILEPTHHFADETKSSCTHLVRLFGEISKGGAASSGSSCRNI